MSADIYQLIAREIPQLGRDKRILSVLEASVAENVATMLHILQHSIDLEKVHAPAAAEEYARRLAQRGAPIAALLRAYRIGSARFEDWCLQELGRRTDNAAIVSAAGLRIAGVTNAYIDKVSEEGARRDFALSGASVGGDGIRFAFGEPGLGVAGFRRTHQQALSARPWPWQPDHPASSLPPSVRSRRWP